ncbi:MAG: alpha/beta hydrolase [Bdellovibrionaceae bacterium]|nr:alpha/beta hydrolase [Pseudobdellovibrionaceae bacterium]MDW8189483.1 alpha/beta hydrolase [Pseudobdellovibrionaceae bacterium]
MASILSEFNCQFIRGSGENWDPSDINNAHLIKWIFLHGLMGFGQNFRTIARNLPSSCLSLVFDQRGHGKSIRPASGFSPYHYAQDLEQIRQELGWEQFYLVGHSMGGRNAMAYAYSYPKYCVHLIIEDIGPDARPEAIQHYQTLLNTIPTPFPSKKAAKEWLTTEFLKTSFGQKGGLTLALYLYTNLVETTNGSADWRFDRQAILQTIELGRGQDYWKEWKQIRCPITVIRGELSSDLDDQTLQKMLETNPQAKGITIKNAGHWVHFDQPQQFVDVLSSLVDKDTKRP